MDKLKQFVLSNFEGLFILLILISVALINYFLYAKIAFLNFYYLPVLVAGYYLGKRLAVLGAFFTILMVSIFVVADPGQFETTNEFELYFHLTVWGGFLILSGWVVGNLSEKFRRELAETKRLRDELQQEQERLQESNAQLNEYSQNLEQRVRERTAELERSHLTIEALKAKVEEALYSVMDANVARLMIEGKLRNEKRRISILFSDLKDFTYYSDRHAPEQVVGELNNYLHAMEECITRYFGHIDKYMGDGIMVEFGAPVNYQMHALMAVLAGISMQKRVKETYPQWQMRVGVATGPTVLGLFGSQRKSYSCIGDTANMASRLESQCEPGSVYIDEETYKDVNPYVDATRVYAVYGQRASDAALEKQIRNLEQKSLARPEDTQLLFELGQAYFKKRLATPAMECFEKVLKLDPDHTEAKLGFAESKLKQDEFEKIAIKGKSQRVTVYRVVGLVDPLLNREKIPDSFYQKYKHVPDLIKVPEEMVLPNESINGSLRHGRLVATLSYAMADALGLSVQEKNHILIAGFLHDIGNAIIPHELLDTQRKLSETELEVVHKHPAESVKIMKKMGYQAPEAIRMVEAHHERFDGSGYPRGLAGEAIPLGARILAVADSFDAMTSRRRYVETWEYRSALREIEKDAAEGRYDPRVVEALKGLMLEE